MNPIFILSAMAALGIEVGWEPLGEGGYEYTIQIEPQLLDVLRQGREIESEVPPHLDVRRYRVTVGTQKLAQIDGEPQDVAKTGQPGVQHPDRAENPFASSPTEPVAEDHAQAGQEPDPLTFSHSEPSAAEHANHKAAPGMLPAISTESKPIENRPAAHHEAEGVDANKPSLPPAAGTEASRPWMPLSIALVLLCCSMGVNVYLGWIARDARRGHREALSKIRAVG